MSAVSLTGQDVIQINGRVLNDLADQDPVVLAFENDKMNVKAGKNGNSIYAQNAMGRLTSCTIRLLLGSSDDKFMRSLSQAQDNSPSTFSLLNGVFNKRVGDGQGNLSTKVYQCGGGVFLRNEDAKTAAEGDTEQSVAVYKIRFAQIGISIQ